jgi:hypothetical protein
VNLGITRMVAATLGLCAFAIAIIAGLAADNPPGRILATGLAAMILCNLLGAGIGAIIERVVAEHIVAYRRTRPVGEHSGPPQHGHATSFHTSQIPHRQLSTIDPNRDPRS